MPSHSNVNEVNGETGMRSNEWLEIAGDMPQKNTQAFLIPFSFGLNTVSFGFYLS